MSVFDILIAVVVVIAFAVLVIRLVTDGVDDRRRSSDPDAQGAWTGADFSDDAHHSSGGHHAHHDPGIHHGGGDFGGGGHHG
ncbi:MULTISPECIES: hypothetical protein [Streptacidiphilus]|uniref:Secreted protein n=1 Tax=Streptacidiphilus cavernicola TaxID=3342716 RepID=A0ABV6UTR8_9ACTN|nr:hypothetical protein [Streptacidiphilus jeojiense]